MTLRTNEPSSPPQGFADFEIESYFANPGLCVCGHRLSHHSPAAVGLRECERECDCMLFTSERGVKPLRRTSRVRSSAPSTFPEYPLELRLKWMIHESMREQRRAIAKNAQRAIERIYTPSSRAD